MKNGKSPCSRYYVPLRNEIRKLLNCIRLRACNYEFSCSLHVHYNATTDLPILHKNCIIHIHFIRFLLWVSNISIKKDMWLIENSSKYTIIITVIDDSRLSHICIWSWADQQKYFVGLECVQMEWQYEIHKKTRQQSERTSSSSLSIKVLASCTIMLIRSSLCPFTT